MKPKKIELTMSRNIKLPTLIKFHGDIKNTHHSGDKLSNSNGEREMRRDSGHLGNGLNPLFVEALNLLFFMRYLKKHTIEERRGGQFAEEECWFPDTDLAISHH